MSTNIAQDFMTKEEAAERLGLSLRQFSALMRKGNYEFTALAPNAGPQRHGPSSWGLTTAQLDKVITGQARRPNSTPSPA